MNYNLELNADDFFKTAKIIETKISKLKQARNEILEDLANYTTERIIYYILTTTNGEGTDELVNSIQKSDIFNDTIEVFTENSYAKYVEFGTGIVGASDSHPQASDNNWKYDINEHGEKGWKYQDINGIWHWTKGQISHQFMYKAFQDLQNVYIQRAEAILRKDGII